MMPILAPAGVQEILDYGPLGWALEPLRRRLGRPQMRQGQIESTAVGRRLARPRAPVEPQDFPLPPGGLNIRRVDGVLAQEERLHEHKLLGGASPGSPPTGSIALDHDRRRGGEARHRHRRQGLSRRAPGARRARPRRGALRRARPAALQGRLRLAARAGGPEGLRRRPRRDRRRRGEARADRDAVARNPLRRRASARRRRQARRGGRLAVAEQGRA